MIYEIPYNLAQVSATHLLEPSKAQICNKFYHGKRVFSFGFTTMLLIILQN